ncbi:extracellular calcium-sensing receptor-like [Pseudophryne corroboree]|uniref:extracellular calcium-sensing receptor-like n=1 Tax=Pseudophryne corroboree TaxID=495146 RepID=UPI003081EE3F
MESFTQHADILLGAVFVVHSGFEFQQPSFQEHPKPALCTGFHIRYYRDVLGVMFAIEEINKSADLLPNITLGFSLVDSCMSELRAVGGALSLLAGVRTPSPGFDCHFRSFMVGIIGELVSALSLPIAQILGVLHYPQISHGATLAALSNKINFPSFLRTSPSNRFQSVAFTQLLGLFGWTWVGMVVVDNDVGNQGAQAIQAAIERSGVCLAFLEKIHLSYSAKQVKRVVDVIKESSASVLILHGPEVHVKTLLDTMFDEGVTGKIFMSSASFGMTPGLFSKKAWKVLNGTIGFIANTGTMPGFEEFLLHLHPSGNSTYPFTRLFWESTFNCRWPRGDLEPDNSTGPDIKEKVSCTGAEEFGEKMPYLFETNNLSYTYHAYLAVYAYAYALHSLLGCHTKEKGGFNNAPCEDITAAQPWKVLHYLKRTSFYGKSDQAVTFNSDGDLPPSYDIINIQIINNSFNLVKVGRFDPEAKLGDRITLNISAALWNEHFPHVPVSVCSESCHPGQRRAPQTRRPICCYDCVACPAGEVANGTDADKCLRCPFDQWSSNERDRCIPRVVEFLAYEEPLGIMLVAMVVSFSTLTLCILVVFIKHQETPMVKATNRELSYILLVSLILGFLCCLVFIGQPSTFSCLLRQTLFSVVFSISISSVLAKTSMVILAFKATRLNSPYRKWLGPSIPRNVVGCCFILQIVICSVWLYNSPPFPALSDDPESHKIIFECNEGQKLFFYVTLGFLGCLAMVSFFVAFLARNLPRSFNEAKLITFSMLVFCSVWASYIPAYLSTSGKYTVAVQVFAILASSAGLLICIFLPKCYIIILRPEKNNKKHLTSRRVNRNGI